MGPLIILIGSVYLKPWPASVAGEWVSSDNCDVGVEVPLASCGGIWSVSVDEFSSEELVKLGVGEIEGDSGGD